MKINRYMAGNIFPSKSLTVALKKVWDSEPEYSMIIFYSIQLEFLLLRLEYLLTILT